MGRRHQRDAALDAELKRIMSMTEAELVESMGGQGAFDAAVAAARERFERAVAEADRRTDMTKTPSDHAGADLRVSDTRTSAQFIEKLNDAEAPLPWDMNGGGEVVDADGYVVCNIVGDHAEMIAGMIVVAVNTCGSFRATRGK